MRNGTTSRRRVAAEEGYNLDELDAEIAADNARGDALGLVFDADPRKTSRAGLTQARPEGTTLPPTEIDPDDDTSQDDQRRA